MKTGKPSRIPGLAALWAATLASQLISSTVSAESPPVIPLPPSVQPDSNKTASQQAGLKVNELRVKSRRDGVQVQRESGATDYYDERVGGLGAESGELGEHGALRVWRFGGQTAPKK